MWFGISSELVEREEGVQLTLPRNMFTFNKKNKLASVVCLTTLSLVSTAPVLAQLSPMPRFWSIETQAVGPGGGGPGGPTERRIEQYDNPPAPYSLTPNVPGGGGGGGGRFGPQPMPGLY